MRKRRPASAAKRHALFKWKYGIPEYRSLEYGAPTQAFRELFSLFSPPPLAEDRKPRGAEPGVDGSHGASILELFHGPGKVWAREPAPRRSASIRPLLRPSSARRATSNEQGLASSSSSPEAGQPAGRPSWFRAVRPTRPAGALWQKPYQLGLRPHAGPLLILVHS